MHEIIQDIFNIYVDHYTRRGDYSATELINPPRVVILNHRYPECSKITAMKKSAASLIGTGVHHYLEYLLKPYSSKYKLEQRMTMKMMDRVLSGTYDILVDNKDIYDIKTAKTWQTIFDPDMIKWHEQQNIYAWLLNKNGGKAESINIIAVYLDWIEGLTSRSKTYPQEPMIVYPLDLWDLGDTQLFIENKLNDLIHCESIDDDDLPACTRDERWEKFPEGVQIKYAVMKTDKSKRAMRVLFDKEETIKYCRESKGITSASYIEIRYAKRTRCEKYCDVNVKCNHYLSYKKDIENDTLSDVVPMDLVLNGTWGAYD